MGYGTIKTTSRTDSKAFVAEVRDFRRKLTNDQHHLQQLTKSLEQLVKETVRFEIVGRHDVESVELISAEAVKYALRIHRAASDLKLKINNFFGDIP